MAKKEVKTHHRILINNVYFVVDKMRMYKQKEASIEELRQFHRELHLILNLINHFSGQHNDFMETLTTSLQSTIQRIGTIRQKNITTEKLLHVLGGRVMARKLRNA